MTLYNQLLQWAIQSVNTHDLFKTMMLRTPDDFSECVNTKLPFVLSQTYEYRMNTHTYNLELIFTLSKIKISW